MKYKTIKEVAFKSGRVIAKGTEFSVSFFRDRPWSCEIHPENGDSFKMKVAGLPRLTNEIHSPGMEDLEEWVCDSICESVLGEQVEPDGWDEHGSPSWLLALGMI